MSLSKNLLQAQLHIVFCCSMVSLTLVANTEESIVLGSGAPTIYVNCIGSTIQNENSSINDQRITQSVKTPLLPEFSAPCSTEDVKQAFYRLTDQAHYFATNYHWHIALGTITGLYAYLCYYLNNINNMIKNPYSWCMWKESTPLTRLVVSAKEELTSQLLLDIRKRYYHSYSMLNSSTINEMFLHDAHQELSMLNTYLSIFKIAHTCRVYKALPLFSHADFIEQRIARLNFVIDLFIEWCMQQEERAK